MAASSSSSSAPETRFSMLRFLARVAISLTVPIVAIGAVLWWFVAADQVDRALSDRADAMSRAVALAVAPQVVPGELTPSVGDARRLAAEVDRALVAQFGDIDIDLVDPVGTVVWSDTAADIGQVVAIDGPRRTALSGVPDGVRLTAVADPVVGEERQPVRYVVPVAVEGRTVVVADVTVADDAAVAGAIEAGAGLAWLFGGAFLALVIAMVPLGWLSLGDIRRNMRQTRTLAMSDNLTGLANRTQFHMRLTEAIAGAQRSAHQVGLVLLDLDGFKAINDTGGHAAGDRLLRRVAAGLGEVTRRNELACRLGGDEFAVVVPRIEDREELRGLADRLHGKLDLPVTFADGRTLRVTASIGMALYPDDARNPDDLVSVADAAMYQVKLARKSKLPPSLRSQAVR